MIQISYGATALNPHSGALGIYPNAFHRGQVDHKTVVAQSETRPAVASTEDRDGKAILASRIDSLYHVGSIDAARNRAGPPVDHCVVDGSCVVVSRVGWSNHLAVQS